MLPDESEPAIEARATRGPDGEPLRCPTCGVTFALVVGRVGPCGDCLRRAEAERAARRAARAEVRPCADGCGATVTGQAIYASATCRSRASRARRRVAVA